MSKMVKKIVKMIDYAHIDIFHKKGYWFKIWMDILRPILAKIELICQQTTMPQLTGVHPSSEVLRGMTGGSWGCSGYDRHLVLDIATSEEAS